MARKYTKDEITVLEGLEPVRQRPAMYIGDTARRGYHHLLWEIVDNSVDEAINGHATTIEVELDADRKGATITDNGRGIPVGMMKKYKKPALELILTTLHAGGKFGQGNYEVSGGLHGVGSSVVNALSESMRADIFRDSEHWRQDYERGHPKTKVKKIGPTRGKRGTTIHFRPDPEIFGSKLCFDPKTVRERLEAKSYLHSGLRIVFKDPAGNHREELFHPGGLVEYLGAIVSQRGKPAISPEPFTLDKQDLPRIEVALTWTEAPEERLVTFANGIPTASGGTHEAGLKSALNRAVRGFIAAKKITIKGVSLTADDIREGVVALLSVYVRNPQFQGQTKDRLNNPEIASPVETAIRNALEHWLLENSSVGEMIVARIITAARAREASRAASAQVKRKTAVSHRLNLPGKLADCSSTDPGESELFLVEGDSGAGTAKRGRNRRTQAILALRGKVLNAERASAKQVLANKELSNIVSALGCGMGKQFDISRLRYNRIFLLMDADTDGHHIATLLLTFFYRVMPDLVREGHIFLAQPPLYRIDAGKATHWALDDDDRDRILSELPGNVKPQISRFKGLGEMNPDELKETTMDPKRRRALRVTIDDPLVTDQTINDLMGKDPAPRYEFIMKHAPKAQADALDV